MRCHEEAISVPQSMNRITLENHNDAIDGVYFFPFCSEPEPCLEGASCAKASIRPYLRSTSVLRFVSDHHLPRFPNCWVSLGQAAALV